MLFLFYKGFKGFYKYNSLGGFSGLQIFFTDLYLFGCLCWFNSSYLKKCVFVCLLDVRYRFVSV